MRALMRSLAPDALRGRRRPRRPLPARARWRPTCTTTTPTARTAASRSTYFHPDVEEILADTYGLMIYQESVMRVAQKFAGYSLAEADNLRKAMRQEDPRAHGQGAGEVRRRAASATGYGAELGDAAVRHHRAVRRLRLQQEPLLRLRPHRLPDRLPQGELPGRVPRRAAHQRQGQPRQGRGLPQRVPAAGHPGARARRQPVVSPTSSLPVLDDGSEVIPFGLSAVRNVGEGLVELIVAERERERARSPTSTTSATGSTPACSTSARSSR